MNIFLRAKDQAEMDAALLRAQLTGNLDVIGKITNLYTAADFVKKTPYTQEQLNTLDYETALPYSNGLYHANYRGDATPEQLDILKPITIPPPTIPKRVWF